MGEKSPGGREYCFSVFRTPMNAVCPASSASFQQLRSLQTVPRANCTLLILICAVITLAVFRTSAEIRVSTLQPQATGTISFHPELGLLTRAPIGNSIQSTYFQATPSNREFRRGFLEFPPAVMEGRLHKAWLILQEWRGISGPDFPVPPTEHELSFYEADLAVSTNDFDALNTLLTSFQTDENENPKQFAWDVTAAMAALQNQAIGFQIKLVDDPAQTNGSSGTGFLEHSLETATPRLVILTSTDAGAPATPFILLESPLAGQSIVAPVTIPLTATAVDPSGYLARVEFFANDNYIGASSTYPYLSFPPETPVLHRLDWKGITTGSYSITARGTDSQGNIVTSVPIQFTALSSETPATGTITRAVGSGFSLVSNPTLAQDNSITALFASTPNLPDGFAIYLLEPEGYQRIGFNPLSKTFEPAHLASRPLLPGKGLWVYNPTTNSLTFAFTGQILTNMATSDLPVGLSIAASILGGGGTPADQGFPGESGDVIFSFNPLLQQFESSIYDNIANAWLPPLPTLEPGTAFIVQKRSTATWNHRRASNGLSGRAETTRLHDMFPDQTFEWYEYFGLTTLAAGDRVVLKLSIIPSRSASSTDIGFDAGTGETFFALPFRDGLIHRQLPYRVDTWNNVVITFEGGSTNYTLEINGHTLILPLNSPARTMAAFRLNIGGAEGQKATAWIDDVEVTVNARRLLHVDFDTTRPRRGSHEGQGILTTLPKPATVP